jgi:spermidine synthase
MAAVDDTTKLAAGADREDTLRAGARLHGGEAPSPAIDGSGMESRGRAEILVVGLLFVLSGASALVYQVLWQRILALHSGVGLYSIAMIVGAFMAGLGIGSFLGGVISARISPRTALLAFAALELGIGLFGAASPRIYYDWLYPYAVHLPTPSWRGGLLHLVALLPPTVLMGMSLPLLVRAVVREIGAAGATIGYLYGINLLGAAAGALLAPWVLMPWAGIRGAALAAAASNAVVGLGALTLLARRPPGPASDGHETATAVERPVGDDEAPGRRPLGLWIALYALSGFLALSLEILWFRLMDVAVKSSSFTFGTVLSVYLLGSAVGCLASAPRVARLRRPLRAFLLAQCAILIVSGLAVLVPVVLPPRLPFFKWYVDYWSLYGFYAFGHTWDTEWFLRLYVLVPLVLFFVPTVLMGLSFPVLQRAVHDDVRTTGRKVGLLQAANIGGCLAGSLLVGLIALGRLGSAETLRALMVLGLLFAAAGLRYYGRAFALPALALLALAALLPGNERLWQRLHGVGKEARVALFDEDATSVVAVTPHGDQRLKLSINGRGNSIFPYGDIHTVLGALPALIHPEPSEVAVIGLGSGDTAWAAACRPEVRSVTVFEISSPQPRILRRLAEVYPSPPLRQLLADPRIRVRVADGRHALEAEDTLYDAIEIDAVPPETTGSGNLYSQEFFRRASRRLRPRGVMCSWAPTPRASETFRTVFPYVIANAPGTVLIGSNQRLPVDIETWRARLAAAEPYLGRHRSRDVAAALEGITAAPPPSAAPLNADLFPRDEFGVADGR